MCTSLNHTVHLIMARHLFTCLWNFISTHSQFHRLSNGLISSSTVFFEVQNFTPTCRSMEAGYQAWSRWKSDATVTWLRGYLTWPENFTPGDLLMKRKFWLCVTDSMVYPPTGSMANVGRWAPSLCSWWGTAWFASCDQWLTTNGQLILCIVGQKAFWVNLDVWKFLILNEALEQYSALQCLLYFWPGSFDLFDLAHALVCLTVLWILIH